MSAKRRQVVVWRVTDRCTLACPFCAHDRRLDCPRGEADPDHVLAFGETLARQGRPVLVSFLGGEPFLWPALRRVATRFRALGLAVAVTTNGVALGGLRTRHWAGAVFDEMTLSVDGIGAVHDRLRGWPGGFARLRAAVSSLSAMPHPPLLRANTVLMRETVEALPALCHELAEWGIGEISLNALGGRDRPEFYPANRLMPSQVAWLRLILPGLRQDMAARGVRLLGGEGYLRRIAASASDIRLPVADCGPGLHGLFVERDGTVAPCAYTIGEYGIAPERFPADWRARRAAHPAAACGDCPSTQVFGKFEVPDAA